jgi:hypothetical protein
MRERSGGTMAALATGKMTAEIDGLGADILLTGLPKRNSGFTNFVVVP